MKKNITQLRGYSLIEVIVYIFVFSIVVSGLGAITLATYRHKTIIEDRVNVNEDLRLLTKSIRDDIYLGTDLSVLDNTLTITQPAGNSVLYYLSNGRVYRQVNSEAPVIITAGTTDVRQFVIIDISTPSAAKTIRMTIELANFPKGVQKPLIDEVVTTTFSIKYV